MAWTVERITELCKEYCGRCGIKFNSPVVINGRLTRTLGRCFYEKYGLNWEPIKIEISRQLLETATDKSIEAPLPMKITVMILHFVSIVKRLEQQMILRFILILNAQKEMKRFINIPFTVLVVENLLQEDLVLAALLKNLGISLVNVVIPKLR